MRLLKKILRSFLYSDNFLSRSIYRLLYFKWFSRIKQYKGIIDRTNVDHFLPASQIIRYSNPIDIFFKRPLSLYDLGNQHKHFINQNITFFQENYFLFKNVSLVGPNAVGIDQNGNIILDTANNNIKALSKSTPRLLHNFKNLKIEEELESGISLINLYVNNNLCNYYHWITDSILLLQVIYENPHIKKDIAIIINKNPHTFQIEYLELLGFHHFFQWDHKRVLVKDMVVPSNRTIKTDYGNVLHPRSVQWLKYAINNEIKEDSNDQKIYISRKNSKYRNVTNEDVLIELLTSMEFKILNLEEMSLKSQLVHFKAAKVIIGAHGAGLINMIFSENAKVLELIGDIEEYNSYPYSLFYQLAMVCNHEYSYLECKSIAVDRNTRKPNYNMEVNMVEFKELLTKLVQI